MAERGQRARRLVRARLWAWLSRRPVQLLLLMLTYLFFCLALLLRLQMPALAGLALMPLLAVPPVAYLGYWLIWREFHR
ncbi:hypothetical protein [Vulcanococcus limneticus]|uniref:hypothetical protein n=1 Tax=Vulcanococcus limneticus TaxID=2170428 RepID=UPI00398BE5AA